MTIPRRPHGMPEHLDYPHVAVDAILEGSARQFPDRVAVLDGDLALTYAELHDRVRRVAQGLRERGIRPGDVVALHQPNSVWYTVTYYGVLLSGATVAPINPTLPAAAVRDQLQDCGAVAAITHPTVAPSLHEAGTQDLKFLVMVPPSAVAPAPAEATASLPGAVQLEELLDAEPISDLTISPDSVAHLSFTGGTTGRSKSVRVLHRNVVGNSLQLACWWTSSLPSVDSEGGLLLEPVTAAVTPHTVLPGEGCTIAVFPLFHAAGLVSQNTSVLMGSTAVFTGRFDPTHYLDLVQEHGVTTVSGSPSFFHLLLAEAKRRSRDLSTVRTVNSGSAPIDTTTLRAVEKLFPHALVVEAYGLTEATMALCSGIIDTNDRAPIGSVGVPIFDTDLEIRDLVDIDKTLPTGEIGEIWARGPQITDGYLGHPELTAEQFRDGWLRTGDLGHLDEQGYLFIAGRAKDMLIYKGYNIYPGHLEEILSKHPAVEQVSVIGAPAGAVGEIPVAYVVPKGSATETSTDFADELSAFVADRVAPYQRVREVRIVESLPTSAAGKILKTELRRMYQADSAT